MYSDVTQLLSVDLFSVDSTWLTTDQFDTAAVLLSSDTILDRWRDQSEAALWNFIHSCGTLFAWVVPYSLGRYLWYTVAITLT